MFGFCQSHDMPQQPVAERKDQNGADIDSKEFKAALSR